MQVVRVYLVIVQQKVLRHRLLTKQTTSELSEIVLKPLASHLITESYSDICLLQVGVDENFGYRANVEMQFKLNLDKVFD